jgi:hypothetical protein
MMLPEMNFRGVSEALKEGTSLGNLNVWFLTLDNILEAPDDTEINRQIWEGRRPHDEARKLLEAPKNADKQAYISEF